jgi:hypothetical protein
MRGDLLRRWAAAIDRRLDPKPPYRHRATRIADAIVAAQSRILLAARVAWLALSGDATFFARWEARHIHGVERFIRDQGDAKELARLRAALAEEPHPNLREQLGALRLRCEAQAREIRTMQEAAERRNRDLAALHIVWCDGGCSGGVGCREGLDRATVEAAVRNTRRLVRWWNSAAYRKGAAVYATERVEMEGVSDAEEGAPNA